MKNFVTLNLILNLTMFVAMFHSSCAGLLDRLSHPGWGHCKRCGMTWASVKSHITDYGRKITGTDLAGQGIFSLCESCWESLTPEQRLPFYRKHWEQWPKGYANWDEIKEAVLAGGVLI